MSAPLPATRRAWLLNEYAKGPITDSTLKLIEEPMPDASRLPPSHILVRVQHIGMEPAMRLSISEDKSYRAPHPLGKPLWARGIGQVVASSDQQYPVGAKVVGMLQFQEYALLDTTQPGNVQPYEEEIGMEYLSAMGIPGRAAYAGLVLVAGLNKGDTVLVSGAAGATGAAVVQIAKARGAAKIIGIASKKKCQSVVDVGADDCLDYASPTFAEDLKRVTQEQVTVYFDNVGGAITDAALPCMAEYGRIAVCGAIAEYQETGKDDSEAQRRGLRNFRYVLLMRLTIKGYVLPDFDAKEQAEITEQLSALVRAGQLKSRLFEYPQSGIEHAVDALQGLLDGMNHGKMMLKIAD